MELQNLTKEQMQALRKTDVRRCFSSVNLVTI